MDVSIIICTLNRAASLQGTLDSLAAIRSEREWEVILLDSSSDNTAEVVKAADDCGGRLRYAYEEPLGLGAARDTAWRLARGRICAFTDDDCYLDPGFVDAVAAAFDDHPDAGCIGGRILLYDPEDAPITIDERTEPRTISARQPVSAGELQGANLSIPRSVLETVGGFDRNMGAGTPFPCEDVDVLAATLWAGYPAYFDPRPVVHHHHGRRGEAAQRVAEVYDRGRGAYYAKFILRRDTRFVYLRNWLMAGRWNPHLTQASMTREFNTARAYFRHRRAHLARLMMEPFFLTARLVKYYSDARRRP